MDKDPSVRYLVRDERELEELQKNYKLLQKYCLIRGGSNEDFEISISKEFDKKDPFYLGKEEYILIDSKSHLYSSFKIESKKKKVSKNLTTNIITFEEENIFFKIAGKK